MDWASILSALKLPARIIAGLFLFCLLALFLDYIGIVELAKVHALARLFLILGTVLSGSLSLAAVGGLTYDAVSHRHKTKLLSVRRDLRRADNERAREEHEKSVLARLDYLTKEEIAIVADCLRKNEQSFTNWVHSSHVANLMAKEFVGTPGGTHHQDYYPYYFFDFVWQALLARRDEFIAKDDENRRLEREEERRARGR